GRIGRTLPSPHHLMSEHMPSATSAASSSSTEPAAPSVPAKPASRWEDFIDLFYAPSTVYARRAQSGFFIPLLVVTLITGILFLVNSGVLAPIMDAEMARGMAKQSQKMTAEQIAGARKFAEVFAKIGAFVFIPI